MAYNNKEDKTPTCVNILKLQRYNFKFFTLEEVVFFEYLLVKAKAFGFGQFYHSTETISGETGIKRTKLDTIIGKFSGLGILQVEVKAFRRSSTSKLTSSAYILYWLKSTRVQKTANCQLIC